MSKAHCKGCGAKLQTSDPNKVGYTPDLRKDFCQDCFRLSHYGEAKSHFHPDTLPTLKPKSLALMICSVMALDMLFFYPLHRYAPDVKYTYIINQVDLLPDSTNLDLLLKSIMRRAKEMKVPFEDIILMSAKHEDDVLHLKAYIMSYDVRNVYLLGVQNAGKTTLYKTLVADDKALAMNKAGLTQEVISHKLSSNQTLHDMPGLYQEGYLHQLFSYDIYKSLLVNKQLKPVIYQLKKNQSLMIEGLIGVTVHQDMSVVIYANQQVKVHRTNEAKLLTLMNEKTLKDRVYSETYETRTYKLPFGKQQLTFADFGFMHIPGDSLVTVTYPKALHMSMTEALFS